MNPRQESRIIVGQLEAGWPNKLPRPVRLFFSAVFTGWGEVRTWVKSKVG